jgi:hypothetical protein
MIGNDVSVIVESLKAPIPLISTAELQIKGALDKITPYSRNFVTGGIPSASLMGPTGQGIINTGMKFAKMI